MISDDTVLGVSGVLTAEQVSQLIHDLTVAWAVIFKRSPGDLDEDLRASRSWFDPVAQGQRLRREISRLDHMPDRLGDPHPTLTLRLDKRKWLVTPEGRCVLDLLKALPKEQAFYNVTEAQTAPYERRLAILYREWSRHRLNSVVALLAGTTKPLQIPAAGIVVALLVNRSTSPERALVRYTSDPERSLVDRAFFAPVQAFADVLSPNRRRSTISAQLISGWMLYEARRRIGDALVLTEMRDNENGSVWVHPDSISTVIDTVARDLARGHRSRVTTENLAKAFDHLVSELRRESKALAGFALAHERPRDTQSLRKRFVDRLSHYQQSQEMTSPVTWFELGQQIAESHARHASNTVDVIPIVVEDLHIAKPLLYALTDIHEGYFIDASDYNADPRQDLNVFRPIPGTRDHVRHAAIETALSNSGKSVKIVDAGDGLLDASFRGSNISANLSAGDRSLQAIARAIAHKCLEEVDFAVISYKNGVLDERSKKAAWDLMVRHVNGAPNKKPQTLVIVVESAIHIDVHCESQFGFQFAIEQGQLLYRRGADHLRLASKQIVDQSNSSPIIFFLGAGFSVSSHIPLGDQLRDNAILRILDDPQYQELDSTGLGIQFHKFLSSMQGKPGLAFQRQEVYEFPVLRQRTNPRTCIGC